jgi:hypothetical protein
VIAAAPATLNPAPRTCTSRRIDVVQHVRDSGEGRAGGGGGAQIGEEEWGRGQGAGADAYSFGKGISDSGALVEDDGSVPPSPGRMLARGIMEHLLVTMVSLPASLLSVMQATVIFFI